MSAMREKRSPRTPNGWFGNDRSVDENDTKRWLNLAKWNLLLLSSPISNEMIRVPCTFSNRFHTFSLSKTYVIDSSIENETESERDVCLACENSSNVHRTWQGKRIERSLLTSTFDEDLLRNPSHGVIRCNYRLKHLSPRIGISLLSGCLWIVASRSGDSLEKHDQD